MINEGHIEGRRVIPWTHAIGVVKVVQPSAREIARLPFKRLFATGRINAETLEVELLAVAIILGTDDEAVTCDTAPYLVDCR